VAGLTHPEDGNPRTEVAQALPAFRIDGRDPE
jgi:hypothetical protein